MKAVVGAFDQGKALVGAFSVITNLRMELFEAPADTRGQGEQERGRQPHHTHGAARQVLTGGGARAF